MLSFNGYNSNTLTFIGSDNITAGTVVKVSGDATVAACSSGDVFFGVAENSRNGITCVQVSGYMELPYSGTAPTYGYVSLVADGSGGVKTGTGRSVTVVMVDTSAKVCGFIL